VTEQPKLSTEDQAERSIPADVVVRELDLAGKRFLSQYRQVILFKRALMEPVLASPDEVEKAVDFLVSHVVKPDAATARAMIEDFTLQQLLDLFTKIAGQAAATPNVKSDGNSGSG